MLQINRIENNYDDSYFLTACRATQLCFEDDVDEIHAVYLFNNGTS